MSMNRATETALNGCCLWHGRRKLEVWACEAQENPGRYPQMGSVLVGPPCFPATTRPDINSA